MLFSTSTLALLLGASPFTVAFVASKTQKRDTHSQLKIGKSMIPFGTLNGAQVVGDGLRELCTGNGCDEGSTFTRWSKERFKTFGPKDNCEWTVSASGNFDSEDERDYLISVLTAALTATAEVNTITESIIDQGLLTFDPDCYKQGQRLCETRQFEVTSGVGFQQAVLNLKDGANKAELKYHLKQACEKEHGFKCAKAVEENLKDGLSSVPGVGPIAAQFFDIFCA
jgi:hypothetical protein